MSRKLTHGALPDYALPPWGKRETWDEWLERILGVPMKLWKTIHWKAATTALGMTLEDLKSERCRSSDFINAETTILGIAANSLRSDNSLITKLDQQIHTLIQVKRKQDSNLAKGRPQGNKRLKDRAANRTEIIEREIGTLLRNPATALNGNDWIANFIFKRQDSFGIEKPFYKISTILSKTKKIAAKHRKELKK